VARHPTLIHRLCPSIPQQSRWKSSKILNSVSHSAIEAPRLVESRHGLFVTGMITHVPNQRPGSPGLPLSRLSKHDRREQLRLEPFPHFSGKRKSQHATPNENRVSSNGRTGKGMGVETWAYRTSMGLHTLSSQFGSSETHEGHTYGGECGDHFQYHGNNNVHDEQMIGTKTLYSRHLLAFSAIWPWTK
jgi:hypothetical protein